MTTENFPKSIEMNIEVKTYDIDVAGHVNNMVYVRWLEDLRNELFSRIYPLEKLIEINYYPVVISTEMKYKSEIKLFDKPIGRIFLESYSHGVIMLKIEICLNDDTAFTATQKCVLMNLTTHKMLMGSFEKLIQKY